MKPSPGRIVLYRQLSSNGTIEHPAIINRVWSDVCVNLTVFPDCGVATNKTSVIQDEDTNLSKNQNAWRWPPRIE
jgi:hypothetical protein